MHIDTIEEYLSKRYTVKDLQKFLDENVEEDTEKGRKCKYVKCIVSFDIESSSFYKNKDKCACMYNWQSSINGTVFMGRTWDEFIEYCHILSCFFELDTSKRLIIWVHNLSFEYQWMRKYFVWSQVFSSKQRKVIYAVTSDGIEFRCSYIMSQMSLSKMAESVTTYKMQKMVGDLDYNLLRTSVTTLDDTELGYCVMDVQIIVAYIDEQIKIYGNIHDLPLTNTGRVRTFVRSMCQGPLSNGGFRSYRDLMNSLRLSVDEYNVLKESYSGGFSHASCNHCLTVIDNVDSIDFVSSYPAVMLSEKFPMSKGMKVEVATIAELIRYMKIYGCVFTISMTNVRATFECEHFISQSKCKICEDAVIDNGRVVSALHMSITMTNVDFETFIKVYNFDEYSITNLYIYKMGYLPIGIIKSVLKLYSDKTKLKHVKGREVDYVMAKCMLNSIYGMMVTDICMENDAYENNEWIKKSGNIEDDVTKYNKSLNRFLFYPWGVFISAYAKRNLWMGIMSIGEDYIYTDTDSIKFTNFDKHKDFIAKYDRFVYDKMCKMCEFYGIDRDELSPKNVDGDVCTIGLWDWETRVHKYDNFKTLGAKRYMYKVGDKYTLTVSGVDKKTAMPWLNDNFKDPFDAFTDELVFPAEYSGKLTHTYIDDIIEIEVTDYQGNTSTIKELSSVHLEKTEYEMSISEDYIKYLGGIM